MELEECCRGLESTKVTERARSIKQISFLLQNSEILDRIRNRNTCSWDHIVFSTYLCLMKDAEKYMEDMKKKNSSTVAKELNGKTFFDIVELAINQSTDLDFSKLLSYVESFLERKTMKDLYGKSCLMTLKNHILLSDDFRSNLEPSDWTGLLTTLKKLCESPETLQHNNYVQVECVSLLIKWGPLYSFPPDVLREEFTFVTEICKSVRQSSLRPHKEIILQLAIEFCKHTAKDNRMACCKLGEELFSYFMELYEVNVREDKLKVQLLEFFLLQVGIHHPKGAPADHPASCAYEWSTWTTYLRSIYRQLCEEIDFNMKCRNKNAILFFVNAAGRQELNETYLNLFLEVGKQVLNKVYSDASITVTSDATAENSNSKRLKLEINIRTLINNIRQTQNWPWIQVTYSILKIYPDTIFKEDYMFLLASLESLQKACLDQDLRFHIYRCLAVLKEMEAGVDSFRSRETSLLWKTIAETTFKEAGLHLCTAVIEKLLQLLSSDENLHLEQPILKVFQTSTNFTKGRIDSLYLYGQNYDFPKSENNMVKKQIIEQVLNGNNSKNIDCFTYDLTAKLLFNFTLKHWMSQDKLSKCDVFLLKRPHNEMTDVYFKTCFEDVVMAEQASDKSNRNLQTPLVAVEVEQFLLTSLEKLASNVHQNHSGDLEVVLSTVILFKNVSTQFYNCGIVEDILILSNSLKSLFDNFTQVFSNLSASKDELSVKKITRGLELFHEFLCQTNDPFILTKVLSLISKNLMMVLFNIFNDNAKKHYSSTKDIKFQLTLRTMKVIATYAFISGHNGRDQTQCFAFEALVGFDYDFQREYQYMLAQTFLSALVVCKPGSLDEGCLNSLLDFIKNICAVRYCLYETALEVLKAIKLILIHLKNSYSGTVMTYIVGLLEPFYNRHNKYGPKISVLIVECFDLLCQIDSKSGICTNSIGDNLIITNLSEFLCSHHQEVRFAAVNSIANFFSSDAATIRNIQQEKFNRIFQLSLQLFEIQGSVSTERRIDETLTRSASVLQTFVSLALSNIVWVQESLFAAIRITHIKKLDSLEKVISLLAKHFGMKNKNELLEDNLEYIIKRWIYYKYNFDAFPFHLLDCSDKKDFCVKYFNTVAEFLIGADNDDTLILVLQATKKDKKKLLQECTVKILARCIGVDGVDKLSNIARSNKTLVKLIELLGMDLFKETIRNDVAILIYELLQGVSDEAHFERHFAIPASFPISCGNSLTVDQFEIFLRYLEKDIYNVNNLIAYLTQHETYNLHKLTLALKVELDKTKFNKSKMFHSYFIIICLLSEHLSQRFPYHEYFIRDTIMYLLNLMEDHTKNKKVSIVASHSLNFFIKKILPEFSDNVCPFFHIIVNKLSNLAIYSGDLKATCVDALKILVIENSSNFPSNIRTLDPFPQGIEFESLRTLHTQIRYENQNITLQKDIEYFLNCGYETKFSDLREEGLKHLLKQLHNKKEDLCTIYLQLRDVQSPQEDCKGNILHQLIIMLVKLTQSKTSNISVEASRCLGELGVMNLNTLILEPDKETLSEHLSPLETLCGHIISHLQLYSIDQNVHLVSASTDGLYRSLESKEGRKVAKGNEEFFHGKITWNYLVPFVTSPKTKTDCQIRIDENLAANLNHDDLWCPVDSVSHEDWIVKLVSCLLKTFTDKCFIPKLVSVCEQKVEFCEAVLPYLVYLILTMAKKQVKDLIFEKIGYFFQQHWQKSISNANEIAIPVVLNRTSLKCMLNCIHYIRLQIINASNVKSTKNCINLKLNYLHLAQAANYSMQHFTAILYIELWCQTKFHEIIDSFSKEQQRKHLTSKLLDVVYENIDAQISRVLEDILRSCYKTLGEFDALHGCGTSLFLDPSRRIEHYKDLGRWDQALLYHEVALSNDKSDTNSKKELVNSLKHCSLYKIPVLCNDTDEMDYECLWRLGRWDVDRMGGEVNKDEFEKHRYFALKFLHENDLHNLEMTVNKARTNEIHRIKHISLENSRSIYTVLTRLQSLREIENFVEANTTSSIDQLKRTWDLQNAFMNTDFEYVEPIKEQRIALLRNKLITLENTDIIADASLHLAEYARLENHHSVAMRTLNNLRFCDGLTNNAQSRIQFEDAQLCWAMNDKTSAQHILRHLNNDQQTDQRIRSCALKLAGKWFIESRSENKNVIITNYLLASLNIYKDLERNSEDVANIYDTYDVLGQYSDKEYQQVMDHMNSDMFQQKIRNMEKLKQAANDLRSTQRHRKLTPDEVRAIRIHEQQSAIDESEIENSKKEKNVFLKFAMKYYLLNLGNSDQNNNRIFRVISLFLENRLNLAIAEPINKYLPAIPTYKYITILPQIIPHLSNQNEDLFVSHINEVICKCIQDHPHHTLPLVLSLIYSNKDREFNNSTTNTSTNDARIQSARDLVKKVKQKNKTLNEVITKMEFLSEALIQVAYYKTPPSREKTTKFNIPASLKLSKVKNYINVLLPTYNLAVSKTCSYDNLVGIHSFGDTYNTVGGINAPKRITCRGTDGKVRTQLLKGHDDLRQDAVMQQVFTIMNSLLFANKTTKNLRIRTYKIVPLSMRSGILEWVENSIPIGEYLVGDNEGNIGAHMMYRPNDKRPKECRSLISKAANSTADEKLRVYSNICEDIKPVFHKFFEYSFPQPSVWYERHRAYIYSVATSSMCGYILGIGDRHVQNILVDKSTAEVIHIDFGIAFEQGRCLPTPETVPFRLSRDIIDGMGVCGVDGIFRKSCERTMEVMRHNSQTILTIVEVLLYDPLYTWAVTCAEANKRQKQGQDDSSTDFSSTATADSVSINITAERALLRLTSKLHGTEDGYPVSLEHQVGTLIQQAQDPANLCRLFSGWQAYL